VSGVMYRHLYSVELMVAVPDSSTERSGNTQ